MYKVFTIVFPIFSLVLIGYSFGRTGLIGGDSARALNDYVFYIALPVLMFYQTAIAPLGELLNYPFIFAVVCSNIFILFVSFYSGKFLFNYRNKCASLYAFSAAFPNVAFMGIPLLITAYGENSTLPAVLMAVVGNSVVLGIVILLLETSGKSIHSVREVVSHCSLALIKNPMVACSLLGILMSVVQIREQVNTIC